jgi:hypothetical protein
VPTSPGYIGEPIYSCLTALQPGQAFGGSGYPLTLAQDGRGTYPKGLCPQAEDALTRLMVFWLHEDHTDEEITAVGEAIVSVGDALTR